MSLLYLTTSVNNQRMKMMIDTGANKSFISIQALNSTSSKQFFNRIHRRVFLADGYSSLAVYGEVKLNITMGEMNTFINAYIVKK
ncbi:unnamed protein product [Rotaria sp. Silwood2]|nr:unnamed protein product [Rotaria sp. Silwood2]CAF3055476.1 unnamed protein product [Rotaria sp. Silwood2]CAF3264336.1 unnamed protein product [Rotaria sp. Silwood2]CAF3365875.1 unnamed protein product [Rotaria sp. Silwood2]CAF4108337.1 unnamed protein product [Rotaria sp. Silwood2]